MATTSCAQVIDVRKYFLARRGDFRFAHEFEFIGLPGNADKDRMAMMAAAEEWGS